HGKAVGTLDTYYRPGEMPAAADDAFLRAIADQAAVGLENRQLLMRSEHRALESAALAEIGREVTLGQPMVEALQAISARALAITGAKSVAIYLLDAPTGEWTIAGEAGIAPELSERITHLPVFPNSARQRAIDTGEPVVTPN